MTEFDVVCLNSVGGGRRQTLRRDRPSWDVCEKKGPKSIPSGRHRTGLNVTCAPLARHRKAVPISVLQNPNACFSSLKHPGK